MVQTGLGQGVGTLASDLPARPPALTTVRLPGLPARRVEKAIGRVADASKRWSLPPPQLRTDPAATETETADYRKVMSQRYGFSGNFFVDREALEAFKNVMASLRHPRDFSTIDAIYSSIGSGVNIDRYRGKNTMYLGRDSPPELWIKTLSARPDDEPIYQAWLAADPLNAARGNGASIQLSSGAMERLRAALALVQHPIDFANVSEIRSTSRYALSATDDRGAMRLVDNAPPAALLTALSRDPDAEPAYQAYLREHPLTDEQRRELEPIENDRYRRQLAQRYGFRGRLYFDADTIASFKKVMASVKYPRDFSTVDSISSLGSNRVLSDSASGRNTVYLGTATAPEHWIKVLSARPEDEPAYRAWLAADPLNVARANGATIRLTGDEHRRLRAALALVEKPIDFAKVSQIRSTSSYAISSTDEGGVVTLVEGAAPEAMIAALSRDPDAEPAYRAFLRDHPLSEKQRSEVEYNALVRYRASFARRHAFAGYLYVGDALGRFKEVMASIKYPRDFSAIDTISSSSGYGAGIREVDGKSSISLGEEGPPQQWIKVLSARPDDEPAYRAWLAEDPLNIARANGANIRHYEAASAPIPLDPWTARRRLALAELDQQVGSDANSAAARGLILSADPVIGLPVIERALKKRDRGLLNKAVHHLSTSKPYDAMGSRWDARCGAHLGTECARTSVVASGQTALFRFRASGKRDEAPATWHYLQVDDQTIPVVTPVSAPPEGSMTLETLTRAVAMLPPDVRQHLGTLVVEHQQPTPQRAVQGYTNSADQVITLISSAMNMTKPETVAGVLVHEVGHRVAFELLGADTTGPKWADWKAASALDGASVSEYAETDWHEHFGETYSAWRGALGTPFEAAVRARFKHTFAILDRIVEKSVGAAFNPTDPKHYVYGVRVISAQLADTGDRSGQGEVYYRVHGGERSDVVTAAGGERITYSNDARNLGVVEGARLRNQEVKVDFYDSDVTSDDYLGGVQAKVRMDPRGDPQRLELKTNKGDPVVLEIRAWPSRRPTQR